MNVAYLDIDGHVRGRNPTGRCTCTSRACSHSDIDTGWQSWSIRRDLEWHVAFASVANDLLSLTSARSLIAIEPIAFLAQALGPTAEFEQKNESGTHVERALHVDAFLLARVRR